MAGVTQEFPAAPQQFQTSNTLPAEPQQVQQMAAMMSMAAAGVANNGIVVNGIGDAGTAAMPAPQVPDASAMAALFGAPTPTLPCVDPSVAAAQVYQQMFASYLQQAQMASAAPFAAPSPLPNYSCAAPMPSSPAISVSVEGMKYQYQLTEDDLQKVFSRYGSVREIRVDTVGTLAQITFDDFGYAQAAMNDLNGKVLNGLEGTLRINWADSVGQQPATTAPTYSIMPPFGGGWGYPGSTWPPTPASGLGMMEMSPFSQSPMPSCGSPTPGTPAPKDLMNANNITPDGKAPAHVKGVRKYTCRFLVGIENDKDFQVVRRIIGAKGSNMKRIVKQSEAKLRLRGVGSGYFEGAGQKESNEPLQLCVSCTSSDGYRMATTLVEELMEGVYTDFRTFCKENGRPEPDLHATPQLVSSGRERGSGGGCLSVDQLFSEGSPGLVLSMGDDDDDDDLLGISPKREGGRKRGRRSRGKKSDVSKVEKGEAPRNAPDVEEIQQAIDNRNEARRQCNFAEADRIRQSLHERGVALMDEPGGRGKASEVTTWRYWRE